MVIKVYKYLSHLDVKCYQVYKKDGGVFYQTNDKINAENIQFCGSMCVGMHRHLSSCSYDFP